MPDLCPERVKVGFPDRIGKRTQCVDKDGEGEGAFQECVPDAWQKGFLSWVKRWEKTVRLLEVWAHDAIFHGNVLNLLLFWKYGEQVFAKGLVVSFLPVHACLSGMIPASIRSCGQPGGSGA